MTKEDKYLLGVLWKFGTIKPGTNQFVFQSYDKYDQMEYIRKRLAPDKVIKVSERKDPRSGEVKTLYRLNFTNADWADKVRNVRESFNSEYVDKDFIRGLLELKGNVRKINSSVRGLSITLSDQNEINIISNKMAQLFDLKKEFVTVAKKSVEYGGSDTWKIIKDCALSNPKHWGEILKKMNPDE